MSFIKLILHKLPKVMKQRLFSQWWIGLAQTVTLASLTALTTIATTNQPSHAKGHTFYCGKSKGIPVTFARTQDSRIDFDQINSSSVTVKGDILSQGFSEPPKTTKQKVDDLLIQAADKYEIGDYRGAILAYDEVIRLTPNNSEALLYRGSAYDELGDKQAAIKDYNLAIKFNPNYADAYNNRGIVRNDLGDKQGAIDDYNLAIKFNPNYANAYNNRG
ncbi:MAG: tetratricopeptide repeat protein, partial [Dolichospermum sp.]